MKPATKAFITEAMGLAVPQIMRAAKIQFPFLAIWPLSSLGQIVVERILGYALKETVIGVNLFLMDREIQKEVEAFKAAALRAHLAPANATSGEMDALDEEVKNRTRDLLKFGRARL